MDKVEVGYELKQVLSQCFVDSTLVGVLGMVLDFVSSIEDGEVAPLAIGIQTLPDDEEDDRFQLTLHYEIV